MPACSGFRPWYIRSLLGARAPCTTSSPRCDWGLTVGQGDSRVKSGLRRSGVAGAVVEETPASPSPSGRRSRRSELARYFWRGDADGLLLPCTLASTCLACAWCSFSVGDVLAAQALTSGSFPELASLSNAFTSLSWSCAIAFMYARSNSAPESLASLSYVFWWARSSAVGTATFFCEASC